ncbi:hypothetical protein CRM22_006897 [Opisthorchis felineus]|uniref:Mediator of RNA polymerase II transcription subunit 14 n=1 Tax=Opisthorchis felineus TaxID=147828 RepID=A0A4S2LQE6_OPIFE|nr:hypothetical protein CRM22_006897 [Opisthorchis felineus]
MSEATEQEQVVPRPRPDAVPFSVLIEFICQKIYTDLMRLVDLLPSKTDLEKKIEIATFFSRTRHLIIRLEALIKWSNNASKVDKCEKISNFLEEQSFFLINTANTLSRLLRETLVGARLPPFAVLLAIDIFTNRTYTRLPKSIKNCTGAAEAVGNRELSQALLDLNRVIQNRLSLTQIPRQFKIIKIVNGRVHFVVPNEFHVTLTLMSEAVDFPWRILDLRFLTKDPVTNYQSLLHPLQLQFIQTQVQSRLLYRQFDKRPPLIHLYDMLHSFSISLQLDVLHEQAQRARAKRPADQLVIEAYRPGHSMVLSYWHTLSRNQFQAQLSLDGKLQSTAYLLSIHADPVDPQRPLCVSHRPELPEPQSHRIGTILQGNHLSIEKLLARTIITRAEHILQDIRQQLMIFSPGPVQLSDAPLCLHLPLLWPGSPQEFLQFRVDPTQGTVCATCPFLLTSEVDAMLLGWSAHSQVTTVAGTSSDGYSRFTVLSALVSLENALNRPSTRRVCPVSSNPQSYVGDQPLVVAQSRGLRTLAHTEARWRSIICQSLEHLRICIGLVRLIRTARTHRPFWQPARRSLPLILSPVQAKLARNSSSFWATLIRLQQSSMWPIVFVQLFPNDEYYLTCEVVSKPLGVDYRYHLMVCTAVADNSDITVDADGLLISCANSNVSAPALYPTSTGLFLQVTHLVPIEIGSVWFHNPSSSIGLLKSCADKARENALKKRSSRVAELLNRIKTRAAQSVESSPTRPLESTTEDTQPVVPALSKLVGMLEENILSNCFALELSRAGVIHDGVQYDCNGCLSAIRIRSLPSSPPPWQPPGVIPLSDFVHDIVLRPYFDPFTHRRSWQLDLLFTGLVPPRARRIITDRPRRDAQQSGSLHQLRHQTAEWFVTKLEDYAIVVENVIAEWDSLCVMHALSYHVVNNPELHLPRFVSLQSHFNLKTLSLVYNTYYMVEISFRPEQGFTIALGFTPNFSTKNAISSDVPASLTELPRDVDSNPHVIIRQHLEELLNATKSVTSLARALVHTLPFVRAVEPLRDRTLSTNGLKPAIHVNAVRPVRGMVLIALSAHDLVLIYRASLSLRIVLSRQRPTLANNFGSDAIPGREETVQLLDAYRQLSEHSSTPHRGVTPWGDTVLTGLVPLPAFSNFLKALQEAYQMDIEADAWSGLTVTQLAQLVRPPRAAAKLFMSSDGRNRTARNPSNSQRANIPGLLSPLESYLASSLLFHACLSAIHSLDVPIAPLSELVSGSDIADQNLTADVVQTGSFEAHWPLPTLTTHVCLLPQRTGVDVASWRLSLRLSSFQSSSAGPTDCWPQETLNLIEEFFNARVCAPPFQPSAVAAFFRLLTLPPRAFRSIVRLLPFDLHPPTHAAVHIRLGLVGLGTGKRSASSQSGGRTTTVTSSPMDTSAALGAVELFPGLPGVIVRPPRITLQLLVSRTQRPQLSKFPAPPMAQLIPICYDWDANRVVILPGTSGATTTGSSQPGRADSAPNLYQVLREADVEANSNMMASNSGESALVQLALLVTQTAAAASSTTYASTAGATVGSVKPVYGST